MWIEWIVGRMTRTVTKNRKKIDQINCTHNIKLIKCRVIFNGYQCRHECQTVTAKEDKGKTWTNRGNSQHNEKWRLSTAVADVARFQHPDRSGYRKQAQSSTSRWKVKKKKIVVLIYGIPKRRNKIHRLCVCAVKLLICNFRSVSTREEGVAKCNARLAGVFRYYNQLWRFNADFI